MSIATELSRIQADRNTIRAKLVELGLASNVDTLDRLAEAMTGIINQGAVSLAIREGEMVAIPAGFHNGSGTVSISLEEKSVTPTKSVQTVTPSTGKVLRKVTVGAIPDQYQDVTGVTATADKVLTGSKYVDSTGAERDGTMPNNGAISKTIDGLSVISVDVPAGYTNGGTVSLTQDIENALAAI